MHACMDSYKKKHKQLALASEMDNLQADIQDLLSNVSSIRQQLSSQAAERQECLLIEKQAMANRLYSAGLQVCLHSSELEKGACSIRHGGHGFIW